ncbi:MAG: radical SAM protein [Thermodesulfobacteriota bacterium]|nr:radical SAM protein [Thermodesulfobacteriota bacterium]
MPLIDTDILLISLQPDLDTVGLKSLHYTVRDRGFSSVLLYLTEPLAADGQTAEAVKRFIAKRPPRIIGISLMSHEYDQAAFLTNYLKQYFPAIPVIWGGIHPTVAPEMCLADADFVCVGEGEAAVVRLLQALVNGKSVLSIPNIWHVTNGNVVKNPLLPLIETLDSLPVPDHLPVHAVIAHKGQIQQLNAFLFKKYARWRGTVFSVMASRGCPFACTYCCNDFFTRLYGRQHKIRRRSPAALINQIANAVRQFPDIQYVNFHDDCFLATSDAFLADFCQRYKEQVGIPFIVRGIPKFFTERKMRYLKDAGVAWISIGLQSASSRVLSDVYNRKSTVAEFVKAATLIQQFKVAVYYDVILDNPLEREDEKLALIPVLASAPRPYFLQLFSLVLYPGTALYDRIIPRFPERAGQYLAKDYHTYNSTVINRMIRISGYLPAPVMQYLVDEYRKNSGAASFRFSLFFATLVSAIVLEPLTAFRLIRLSRNGKTAEALRILPAYFSVGFSRYRKQFLHWRGIS